MRSIPAFAVAAAVLATGGPSPAIAAVGDANCDSLRNGLDIAPFVLAILDPAGYQAAHPGCPPANADLDCDLTVDAEDVALFVECMVSGNCGDCGMQIETVTVGNPGNPGEAQIDGIFGAVGYVYEMGKYEVTSGQYTAFLNAVAADDPHGLYNANMWAHEHGCKIERTGSPGSYAYSVAPDRANRPVNFVSFGDALRFANWLHNGQPAGAQELTTTEDGSYFVEGKTSDHQLEDVFRNPGATWVVPSEDEWYKAAYHANDGASANYFSYPMGVDFGVSNDLTKPDPGGHATYFRNPNDFTIGAPYFRTEVGAHENSASPYGAFDMGGNVVEFNESIPLFNGRGVRGGSYSQGSDSMGSWSRPIEFHSSDEFSDIGFRVAFIP